MTTYRYRTAICKLGAFLFLSVLIFACQTDKQGSQEKNGEFTITVLNENSGADSLFISDIASDKLLAKFALRADQSDFSFPLETSTIGIVKSKNDLRTYMLFLKPNGKTMLLSDSTSFESVNNLPDSMLNFFLSNINDAFATQEISNAIFREKRPDRVLEIFDSIKEVRTAIVDSLSDQLSEEELELLHFRNESNIHSFLLYYGQQVRNYEPSSSFFNFLKDIDKESRWNKTSPQNLLFKYDVEFLKKKDSIDDLESFLSFIEEKTLDQDLSSFLKAYYIRQVIERPARWKKHEQLFNSVSIKKALEREKNNPYSELIKSASESYFASQEGEIGFNFTAFSPDSLEVRLSDFKGKLVFIDVWATWCGPCVDHRPEVLKLAEKYKGNENIEILMIAVDASKERWVSYINKSNPDRVGNELMIQNGMGTTFGDKYLIKSIPRYILIDSNGVIIDADAPDPSIALDSLIESELEKMLAAKTVNI